MKYNRILIVVLWIGLGNSAESNVLSSQNIEYISSSGIGVTLGGASLWMMYHPSSEKIWNYLPGYRSYKQWEKKRINSKTLQIGKHIAKISLSIGITAAGFYLTKLVVHTNVRRSDNKPQNNQPGLVPLINSEPEPQVNPGSQPNVPPQPRSPIPNPQTNPLLLSHNSLIFAELNRLNEERIEGFAHYQRAQHDYNEGKYGGAAPLERPIPVVSIEDVERTFNHAQEAEKIYREYVVRVIKGDSSDQQKQNFLEKANELDSFLRQNNPFFFVETKMPEEINDYIDHFSGFLEWKNSGLGGPSPDIYTGYPYEVPVVNYQEQVSIEKPLNAPHRDINRVLTDLYWNRIQSHAETEHMEEMRGFLKQQYNKLGEVIDLSKHGFTDPAGQTLENSRQIHSRICQLFPSQFNIEGKLI